MISFDLNMDFVLCASKVKRGLLRDVIMRGGGAHAHCFWAKASRNIKCWFYCLSGPPPRTESKRVFALAIGGPFAFHRWSKGLSP